MLTVSTSVLHSLRVYSIGLVLNQFETSPFSLTIVMNTLFLLFFLASAVVVLLTGRSLHRRKSKGHLPPGPTPLPIIGNILDIPRTNVGPTFLALSKKHGASQSSILPPTDHDQSVPLITHLA